MALTLKARQIADLNITRGKLADNAVNSGKADLASLWDFGAGNLQLGGIQVATLDDVQGRSWKDACRVASTANLTLSGAQTIDGISITAGQRVLVKDQTDLEDNGIYVCAAGAWSRSDDMSVAAEVKGSSVFVMEGTLNSDTSFVVSSDAFATLGTDDITFAIQAHLAELIAGDGLVKTSHSVAVDLGVNSGLELAGGKLQVDLDGTTLERDVNGLHIKALGVTAAQLAANSVETAKINDGAVTSAKIANDAVDRIKINADVAGTGLGQNANGSLEISAGGVVTSMLANDAVDRTKIAADVAGSGLGQNGNGSLEISAGGVATSMIANDAVDRTKIAADVAGTGMAQSGDGSLTIAVGGVATNMIANDAITSALIADDAVVTAAIADDAITAALIADNAITAAAIAADAVGASELADNAVDTAAIADDSVTLAKAGWTPKVEGFAGNGTLTQFSLAQDVPTSHKPGVMAFINGQYMELTAGVAGTGQFSLDTNGGVCRVTLGDTMAADERLVVSYIY